MHLKSLKFILIVESDVTAQSHLRRLLKFIVFEDWPLLQIKQAYSIKEMFACLRITFPDMLFLNGDLYGNGGWGYELVKKILGLRPDIKIVMFSDQEINKKGIGHGAHFALEKEKINMDFLSDPQNEDYVKTLTARLQSLANGDDI